MSPISVPGWQGTARHLGPLAFLSFLHCSCYTCTLSFKLLSVKMCVFVFFNINTLQTAITSAAQRVVRPRKKKQILLSAWNKE